MFGKILITLAFTTLLTYAEAQETRQEEQQETQAAEGQESREAGEPQKQPGGSFYWIHSDSELKGEKFGKHQLEGLERNTEFGGSFEVEEESTQLNEQTALRTIRAYRLDGLGGRSLYQVITEELKSSPDGGYKAVRTTSTADLNGKLTVSKRVQQDTERVGEGVFETKVAVELPDPNRRLRPVERIEQTERLLADESVSIERVQYGTKSNGGWETLKKQVSNSWEVDGVVQTEEQVFRLDGNRRLGLTSESVSKEWKAEDGTLFRTTEESRPNFDGKMEVIQLRQIEQREYSDGMIQRVEQVAGRAIGAQDKKLALLERFTEQTSSGSSGTERTISREGVDATGRFSPISTYRVVTTESGGKKKTTVQ